MKILINSFFVVSLVFVLSVRIIYSQNRQTHKGRPPHSIFFLQDRSPFNPFKHLSLMGDAFPKGRESYGDRQNYLRSSQGSLQKPLHSLSDSVQVVWVSDYASGLVPTHDNASAIAVDGSGNVYVTGSSEGSGSFRDYATIKYNSDGIEQWVARYNGPGNSSDVASAIAVDGTGNVYVTGHSFGLGTDNDYATLKYNSDGVEQWVARYNGPGNYTDLARAIAVDSAGNVYVTGWSYSADYPDYATIKYNSDGIEQWVARYDGPGNSSDYANAIAVDGTGDVYVTGNSEGSGSRDYATIKYNSDGVEQWVARYDGPGNSSDYANAIAVDGTGNVYVTGWSVGSGTSEDYATLKYNSDGVEQWAARYNGPGNSSDYASGIALDDTGNVYVTGGSEGSDIFNDYATLKYNSDGVEQWAVRYNGPENFGDNARAIALDGTGNVYVTGSSAVPGISIDYATLKYNSDGVEQWVKRYDGPGSSDDVASAIAVDGTGNVYVTGNSVGPGTEEDYATVKFTSDGVEQWVARYDGPASSRDYANAIAVDGMGNVYVTGLSEGSGTSEDYATIKYSTDGVEQWLTRYDGPGNFTDIANAIALDGTGNVYVTGKSWGSGTSIDYATLKYNSDGVEQWVGRYNGSGNSTDIANAIAIDGSGNVYVTGWSVGSGSRDYATIKYNTDGVEQWAARYDGPGNSGGYAIAIAVDDTGNVYVTGWSVGLGTSRDYATIKYNTDGVEQWVARYDGPGNSNDNANAIAVDDTGNVYVTGWSVGSESRDYATIKYNSDGIEQWVARYDGPGNFTDMAYAIAIGGTGNIYVTGNSVGSGTTADYATIKYNTDGIEQWVARYDGPGSSSDNARAIAVDGTGHIYVTGSTQLAGQSKYTTIKYVQVPVSVEEETAGVASEFSLSQNYPNPFNPFTNIKYSLPKSGMAVLSIYNLLGHEVALLIDERKPAGSYTVKWDASHLPSGIYFYRLQAGDFVRTRKMVLLK